MPTQQFWASYCCTGAGFCPSSSVFLCQLLFQQHYCISVIAEWYSGPQYQRNKSYRTPTTKRKIYIMMVLCYQPTLAFSNRHEHMAGLLTGDVWRRASMWVLRASWQAAIWANSVRIQDRWEQEAASARTRQSHHQCTKCYSLSQATFIRLSLLLLDWVQNLVK